MCPSLHFSYIADYFYGFCSKPDLDVGPSVLARDVEHSSFHCDLCSSRFVLYNCMKDTP